MRCPHPPAPVIVPPNKDGVVPCSILNCPVTMLPGEWVVIIPDEVDSAQGSPYCVVCTVGILARAEVGILADTTGAGRDSAAASAWWRARLARAIVALVDGAPPSDAAYGLAVWKRGLLPILRSTREYTLHSLLLEKRFSPELGPAISILSRFNQFAQEEIADRKLPWAPPWDCHADARCIASLLRLRTGILDAQPSSEEMASRIYLMRMALRLGECGFPAVKLSESLTAALLATDPSTLTGDQVRAPFPALVIQLDRGIPFGDTTHEVVRVMFTTYRIPPAGVEYADAMEELPLRRDDEGVFSVGADALRAELRSMCVDDVWLLTLVAWDGNHLDIQVRRPRPDERIGEWLRRVGMLEDNEGAAKAGKWGPLFKKFASLFVNLCVWMGESKEFTGRTGRPAQTKAGGKPTRIHREWTLGSEVRLPSQMIRAIFAQRADAPKWKIQSRFIVRGHWRNQVCGEGRKDRQRIWIQPFWKGPAEGPQLDRLYAADVKPQQ